MDDNLVTIPVDVFYSPHPCRCLQVIRHRSDEERSCIYERLIEVEEMAKAAKRGLHSNKEVAVPRQNDVSAPGNAARARQFLPHFQRATKMQVRQHQLVGQSAG